MRAPFNPAKRDKTLAYRGLDFADAAFVFKDDIQRGRRIWLMSQFKYCDTKQRIATFPR